MTDYLASADLALLQRHGLNDFEALWALQLDAVDEPNTGRGGWSQVFRMELEGKGYYLKRQANYLTRTLHRPFGERRSPASSATSAVTRSSRSRLCTRCSMASARRAASTGRSS